MRRQGLWIMAVVLALCTFAGSAPAAAGGGEARKNKAVARRVFDEILNKQRYELYDQIYTKDFVKHVDLRDETLAEEVRDGKAMGTMSSDLVMTVDDMIAEGDRVAIRYTGRGTSTGPLGDLPATGKKIAATGMTIYRLVDGKIAEEWTTYNMLEILRQLGYYPPPAAK